MTCKFVSSLLSNNKPIWRHNSNNRANLPPLSRALRRMLWTHLLQRSPGYYSESEYHPMRGQANAILNALRVDEEIFESGKNKLRI